MTAHRDAQARTIIEAWREDLLHPDWVNNLAHDAIDALWAEGWSIVKLRRAAEHPIGPQPLYVITEGEA